MKKKPNHFIYRNLHKDCFSIRNERTGLVENHSNFVVILNPKFVVRQAGRKKVLATKRKNVHAGVRGELLHFAPKPLPVEWDSRWQEFMSRIGIPTRRVFQVQYNPYKNETFVTDFGDPVTEADLAILVHRNDRFIVYAIWEK